METSARKPSHFTSNAQPGPFGSSPGRDSIGEDGSCIGAPPTLARCEAAIEREFQKACIQNRRKEETADGFIHTVWKDNGWQNEVEGDGRVPGSYVNKEEAVANGRARAMADLTEHVIHNQDGTISERNSYGTTPRTDPADPAGLSSMGGTGLERVMSARRPPKDGIRRPAPAVRSRTLALPGSRGRGRSGAARLSRCLLRRG